MTSLKYIVEYKYTMKPVVIEVALVTTTTTWTFNFTNGQMEIRGCRWR